MPTKLQPSANDAAPKPDLASMTDADLEASICDLRPRGFGDDRETSAAYHERFAEQQGRLKPRVESPSIQPEPKVWRTTGDDLRDQILNATSDEERQAAQAKLDEYRAAAKRQRQPDNDNAKGAAPETTEQNPWMANARSYIKLGWHIVPCKRGEKFSVKGWAWSKYKLTEADLPQYFGNPETACNIGVVTGDKSKGLADVDLDWPQASAFADILFADCPTFGRSGKLRSHRLADCPGAKTHEFKLPATAAKHPALPKEHALVVVEIRAGGLTILPYGIHASGQTIEADPASPQQQLPTLTPDELNHRVGLVAFCSVVAQLFPPKGTRHDTLLALSGALCRVPWIAAREDCEAFVNQLVTQIASLAGCHARPSDQKLASPTLSKLEDDDAHIWGMPKVCEMLGLPEECIKLFNKWLGLGAEKETETKDGRALIEHNEVGNLTPMFDEVESALRKQCTVVYQRGGELVHIYRLDQQQVEEEAIETNVKRPAEALVIRGLLPPQLRERISNHIQFFRWGVEDDIPIQVPIAVPGSVVSHIAARSERWRFQVLRGIVETPTMREDGSILTEPGYDVLSGLYLDTGGVEFPVIPENPTMEQAKAALGMLLKVIEGFPFDGNPDGTTACPSRSVALSTILSLFCIRTVRAAPDHLIDANAPGTGKSLLIDSAAVIATGKVAAHMEFADDDAENVKRLTGVLVQGDLMVCMDNVDRAIGGAFLCSVITQDSVQVRILGETGQPIVPTNVFICATGNNIKVRGDMTRRAVKCRMDARCEDPEKRKFDVDLIKWVTENRPQLVCAALLVMRAFAIAENRQQTLCNLEPFGSFDAWSERVRAAIVWLDQPDPCATTAAIKQDEETDSKFATLIAEWIEAIGTTRGDLFKDDDWKSLGQICAAKDMEGNSGLRDALTAIMPKPKDVTPEGLGAFLSDRIDRVVGLRDEDGSVTTLYRVRKRLQPKTRAKQYRVERLEAGK